STPELTCLSWFRPWPPLRPPRHRRLARPFRTQPGEKVEDRRTEYNEVRPHSANGDRTPFVLDASASTARGGVHQAGYSRRSPSTLWGAPTRAENAHHRGVKPTLNQTPTCPPQRGLITESRAGVANTAIVTGATAPIIKVPVP